VDSLLTIDGTMGEGGGQVLRSALALSLVTGQPFTAWNVRGGRERPGLLRQHLTAVRAAAAVGDAKVKGDALGSRDLTFIPRAIRPGDYRFAVEGAGSATLVFQTVLPALAGAAAPSTVICEGGTHNRSAPPFDFLARAFLPLVARMGPRVEATLERPGFEPRGGGRFRAAIAPAPWRPLALTERGHVQAVHARAVVAGLPRNIAERELRVLQKKLHWDARDCAVDEAPESQGPGNAVMAEVRCAQVTEVFTGFGRRGVRAEHVASDVARATGAWLEAGVPVGEHLADQLLLPMALAGGGRFVTLPPTPHARTNAEVIRAFLPAVPIAFDERHDGTWEVVIGAA
jgi:RNA 3'-terminal phosphate cyclase (ATP)